MGGHGIKGSRPFLHLSFCLRSTSADLFTSIYEVVELGTSLWMTSGCHNFKCFVNLGCHHMQTSNVAIIKGIILTIILAENQLRWDGMFRRALIKQCSSYPKGLYVGFRTLTSASPSFNVIAMSRLVGYSGSCRSGFTDHDWRACVMLVSPTARDQASLNAKSINT